MAQDIDPKANRSAIALARLYRRGQNLGFTSDTLSYIEQSLQTWLNTDSAAATKAPDTSIARLQLVLRQKVQANEPWERIAPIVDELFRKKPTVEMGARLVELAYLQGSAADIDQLLVRFSQRGLNVYTTIHQKIRAALLRKLMEGGFETGLRQTLLPFSEDATLIPSERLFVLRHLLASNDHDKIAYFLDRYQADIIAGLAECAELFGWQASDALLRFAKIAAVAGDSALVKSLLTPIKSDAPEHTEAFRVLLAESAGGNFLSGKNYIELFLSERNHETRIAMAEALLGKLRHRQSAREVDRNALAEALARPFHWLPEEPSILQAFAECLLRNVDMNDVLPDLFAVCRTLALQFRKQSIEQAFWYPFTEAPAKTIWYGVGCLHRYLESGPLAEEWLWRAHEHFSQTNRPEISWNELHRAGLKWLQEHSKLTAFEQQTMIRQMRMAVEPQTLAELDIQEYLRHAQNPPYKVLAFLASIAASRQSTELETQILQRMTEASHATNAFLEKTWHWHCVRKKWDLAWRTATILASRQALRADIRKIWEISGEKRTDYAYFKVLPANLSLAAWRISTLEAQFAFAILTVGPLLPELFATLDAGAKVVNRDLEELPAKNADKALSVMDWLPKQRKKIRFTHELAQGEHWLPPFVSIYPMNPWSALMLQLGERLGLTAWSWKMSSLAKTLETLNPRGSKIAGQEPVPQLSKWLKKLSPEQRAAWNELNAVAPRISDEAAEDFMAQLVCRLTTMIYPNHAQMLTTLQMMRAPVRLIWGMENWLLSDAYQEWRIRLKIDIKMAVPDSLVAR